MLLNQQGQVVNLPKHLNTREHPNAFTHLREVREPSTQGHAKMFNIETRARIKQ